jgi:CheY-like chemotaxis protein/HPt (histidine-containing phosphotransfer) domain-containing protein
VLLVEDHEINREVAVDILQDAGLSVEAAVNGRAAVDAMRGGQFDVILMDMVMPEMDGLEATRAIRRMPVGRRVPIIAMTANAFDEDRHACHVAGMNDFVSKPVDPQALYSTLERWLPSVGDADDSDAGASAATGSVAVAVGLAAARTDQSPQDRSTAGIMARLSREAGVDPGKGLAAKSGKQEQLIELLRLMATTHRDDMQALQACIERGAQEDARRIAHRIRGVAATLGATGLFNAVGNVEAKLRECPGMAVGDMAGLVAAASRQLELLLEIVGDGGGSA